MSINVQNSPYLPQQRNFPYENIRELASQIDKTYIDISTRVNEKTIGLYAVNYNVITGNKWYLTGSNTRKQTLRRVYLVTGTSAIPHGIDFTQLSRFTNMYGDYTNSGNWYGLIAGSNVAIAGQISFYLDTTNINILVGAGAPTPTDGSIVLEWLSK